MVVVPKVNRFFDDQKSQGDGQRKREDGVLPINPEEMGAGTSSSLTDDDSVTELDGTENDDEEEGTKEELLPKDDGVGTPKEQRTGKKYDGGSNNNVNQREHSSDETMLLKDTESVVGCSEEQHAGKDEEEVYDGTAPHQSKDPPTTFAHAAAVPSKGTKKKSGRQ